MSGHPANVPILDYAPGSPERAALQAELDRQLAPVVEVPCIVDGEAVFTANTVAQVVPHNHTCLLYTSPSPPDLSTSRMPPSA